MSILFSAGLFAKPISVNINNVNPESTSITHAKIRLVSGNEWIELGPVHYGENHFDIDVDIDNSIGSLWLENEENEIFVSHFNKNMDDNVVEFKITSIGGVTEDSERTIEYNTIGSKNNLNYKEIGVNHITNLYKVSPLSNNSWPTVCEFAAAGTTGQKSLICAIKSSPQVVFMSTSDSGFAFRAGIFSGNFSSQHSPSYIKGNQTNFGFQGWLFYSKIKFQGGKDLYFGEFSGGGIGLGLYTGTGIFM